MGGCLTRWSAWPAKCGAATRPLAAFRWVAAPGRVCKEWEEAAINHSERAHARCCSASQCAVFCSAASAAPFPSSVPLPAAHLVWRLPPAAASGQGQGRVLTGERCLPPHRSNSQESLSNLLAAAHNCGSCTTQFNSPLHPPTLLPCVQRQFCFESESWARCIHESCFLSKVFRQVSTEQA